MMQQATANPVSNQIPDAIIQLVRAIARRQARIDARTLEAANDNRQVQ